jgi:glycosyltransferase involved in cell wall biosynthesis
MELKSPTSRTRKFVCATHAEGKEMKTLSKNLPSTVTSPQGGWRPLVILIDWANGGHNATYLNRFLHTLRELNCEVKVVVIRSLQHRLLANPALAPEDRSECFHPVDLPGFVKIRPLWLQGSIRRWMFAGRLAAGVAHFERQAGKKASLLFFSCLFEDDFDLAQHVLAKTPRPWSFLYLHPYYFHPAHPRSLFNSAAVERLLRHPLLNAVATINEDVAGKIRTLAGKRAVIFPDITDEGVEPGHPLLRRIRRFAGNRTMVGLVGLAPWKGVGLLARACLKADPARYAFLFAGQYDEAAYSKEDAQAFAECLNHAPHAFFHLARLPDGPVYNAALSALDIVVCACDNFPFSNNTLTKAALLRKPVIVTANSLAASRVTKHRLGRVIAANDHDALLEAIEALSAAANTGPVIHDDDARDYLALHDGLALSSAFGSLINLSSATLEKMASTSPRGTQAV